eukprot:7383316-Pyramimonas_sp.AAC.1
MESPTTQTSPGIARAGGGEGPPPRDCAGPGPGPTSPFGTRSAPLRHGGGRRSGRELDGAMSIHYGGRQRQKMSPGAPPCALGRIFR